MDPPDPHHPNLIPLCDYCCSQRALVYCKADAARLCLPCDLHVHSANALSRRHLRALICDRCSAHPASVRLPHDRFSLCASCQSSLLGNINRRRCCPINCYSGCPTLPEMSRILAVGNDDGESCAAAAAAAAGGMNMMTINENCESTGWENAVVAVPQEQEQQQQQQQQQMDPWLVAPSGSASWSGSGSGSCVVPAPGTGDQQHKNANIAATLAYQQFTNTGVCDDDGIFDGFNPGNVGFNVDDMDELFGCAQTKYPYQEGEIDGLFMEKIFSVADSNGHVENAVEASSSGQHDSMTLPSSCIAGSSSTLHTINSNSDQMMLSFQSNRNVSMSVSSGNVCQTMLLSLSDLTGESRVADYQDCGVSPMYLSGESPWDSNIETSRPQARNEAKLRYNEKKKSRLFGKQIRYASRKARADTRKRVKGRFVKVGEAYDYDPVPRSS